MSILREELITNHLLLDYFDMWDEFDIKKVDDAKTIRYYNLLSNLFDNQIDASIRWLESDEARDYFFGETEYQTEVFHALENEWDEILEGKYPSVNALLSEVYRRGKAQGYSDMQEHIRYTKQDKEALRLARNYNYHLIRRIDNDTRNQIKNKITEAVIAGEHPTTVAPKILNIANEKLEGSNFTPKQRATMIARTEVSRVQNTGILQSYINEGYTEVKILTADDGNVCELCLRYAFKFEEDADLIYDNHREERVHNIINLIKGGLFPPFHPLCRCTYLCVWESKGEPLNYVIDLNYVGNWMYEYDGTEYRFQGNTPQGRDKFQRKYGVDVDRLDDLSKKFLIMYTDDADRAINNFLRDKWEYDDCEKLWNDTYEKLFGNEKQKLTFKKALEIYDNIFEKFSKTLEEDIIVCRREDERFMGNKKNPKRYKDKGFTSTSINEYVERYGDEINYILIPAGTKIIYLEEITKAKKDYEILIAPGIDLTLVEDMAPRRKVWRIT